MGGKTVLVIALAFVLVASLWFVRADRTGADRPEAGGAFAPEAQAKRSHDRKHVLVRFVRGATSQERAEAHRANAERVDGRLDSIGVDVVRIREGHTPEQAANRYDANPDVEFAEPNFEYSILATPNDPYFPGNGSGPSLWGLDNDGSDGTDDADIDAPEGWDVAGLAGSPWPVADYAIGIIDTGVDRAHPDLDGRVITPCYNVLGGTGTVDKGCVDYNSHGTHVAGTAAAIGNNGRGVVGVAPNARIHMCKALGSDGSGWTADIAKCIERLVDERTLHNINVISLSLGGPATDTMRLAVDRARDEGVLVFAAAGNSGNSSLLYPAAYESVVSVAATDEDDDRASFSNANDDVELAAPGVTTMSTVPGGGYQTKNGTSMATPHAAGVAAFVSWHTGVTGQQLRDQVTLSADDLGLFGRDPVYGYGRVNLCRALAGPCEPHPPGPTPTPSPPPKWTRYDDKVGSYRGYWAVVPNTNAFGGSFHRSSTGGSYMTFDFEGTRFKWIGQRSKRAGVTRVVLDGVKVAAVDGYSPTTLWNQVLYQQTDLPPGRHRLELYATTRKNEAATSYNTYVDAIAVFG